MFNFAVLDKENVVNVIVAESKAIAEEVTGKTCIQYTTESVVAIGDIYVNGTFVKPNL